MERLHYISQELENKGHEDLIREVCEAGASLVQLRVKNKSNAEILSIAKTVKKICDDYKVKLIINDHVEIAKEINASGVHLGKSDTPPSQARELLGDKFIIGGTANTIEDVRLLHQAQVDYIGLGPFRFTPTKENLSPILGLEGYKAILQQCRIENIHTPILAIGGIAPNDISEIMETGIYGIAVSSIISRAENKKEIIKSMTLKLQEHAQDCR